jgi:hypothetical protein
MYANAQRGATQTGDHAAIGAITYNRAALRVAVARFTNLTSQYRRKRLLY